MLAFACRRGNTVLLPHAWGEVPAERAEGVRGRLGGVEVRGVLESGERLGAVKPHAVTPLAADPGRPC